MTTQHCICILNYNNNDNALWLAQEFSKHCSFVFITDSGSYDPHWIFHKSAEAFYTSNLAKASELFLNTRCSGCLYVCSDVVITAAAVEQLVNRLNTIPSTAGLYTPAVNGKSHAFLKPVNSPRKGLREIPFAEGMIFYSKRKLVELLCPFTGNIFGWGIDILFGYTCTTTLKMTCLVDDAIEVYHPPTTSYDASAASFELTNYLLKQSPEMQLFAKAALALS